MEHQQGRLIREHNRVSNAGYTGYGYGFPGEPAFFELHDLTEPLEPDEVIRFVDDHGREFTCHVLSHTNVCAVIEPPSKHHHA